MTDLAYSVEREFDITVPVMWEAWTDAQALASWYHPTDLLLVPGSVVSDPVVGGWWTVAVDVPEWNAVSCFYGRYTALEPRRRIEHTMHYTQDLAEFAARDEATDFHRIVIDMEERGTRTWVRFAQFGDMPEAQAAMAAAGMESYLDSLGAYLARFA